MKIVNGTENHSFGKVSQLKIHETFGSEDASQQRTMQCQQIGYARLRYNLCICLMKQLMH